MENRFNLIISDNPISRAYLNFFKKKTEYINEIIYLNFPSFIFFSNILKANINFKRNNYHAIKLLKNSKVKELIEEIEKFFDFYPGFISEMYNFKNLLLFKKKLKYINSISINSDLLYKKLNSTEDIYINTGNEIIKKPLKKNIKILHIHPGYLPNVKGADSSFHMIDNFNILGVSSFLVNKKIDEGEILFRENIAIPQFKFKYKNSFCLKDKYCYF